ncbi:hypothetical protein AB0910_17700 [Streptomyces sp. NPDC047002]|uniref:hypothetical protein n=1 Tax=Streptomyces sp. NPDC047002 TaxID=3155475 RepID=UPI003455ABF8
MVERLLSADFPGAQELRLQIDDAQVVGRWGTGSVSVDLRVSGDAPASPVSSGVAPVEATVVDESGALVGEIILWTQSGLLSGLEYAWYGDEPPRRLPEVKRIVLAG